MPTESTAKLKAELKQKYQEVKELKEMLAAAEAELKEYTSADNLERPRASILESTFLNKVIKGTFFILLAAVIVMAGLYPWLFKDKILGGEQAASNRTQEVFGEDTDVVSDGGDEVMTDTANETDTNKPAVADTTLDETRDIFQPEQKFVEVVSDLGWLNVRTEPSVETGDVITRLNSGQRYEWLKLTEDNWYQVVIDDKGNTGYASGEYLIEQ